MVKVSSSYRLQNEGLIFGSSATFPHIEDVGYHRAQWRTHGNTIDLVVVFAVKRKVALLHYLYSFELSLTWLVNGEILCTFSCCF